MKFSTIAVIVLIVGLFVGGVWWSKRLVNEELPLGTEILSKNGLHWHATLRIIAKGKEIPVPVNIGLLGGHNPIHTHEPDGVIHMEFEGIVKEDNILLGNFFKIWGKPFSKDEVLDYKNGVGGAIKMLVNGVPNEEFGDYHMKDGDKIEIRYE